MLSISWVLEDNEDLGTRYVPLADGLLIYNLNRTVDNRTFICEALKSSTGQVIKKKIKFIVEHAPIPVTNPVDPETGEPPAWAPNDKVYGFLGESINLTCQVEAEPAPKFEWTSNKGRKKIGRILVESHKSILQLKMTEDAVDKYQCIAKNKYGETSIYFDLKVGMRPDPPGKIYLVKAESNNLELKVDLPSVDNDTINFGMEPRWMNIFYRNIYSEDWSEQIFKINSDTFGLTELNSSSKYEIMAATRNVAGLSSLSNSTFFETKSASSVQISNVSFFSVALINTLILLTSRVA